MPSNNNVGLAFFSPFLLGCLFSRFSYLATVPPGNPRQHVRVSFARSCALLRLHGSVHRPTSMHAQDLTFTLLYWVFARPLLESSGPGRIHSFSFLNSKQWIQTVQCVTMSSYFLTISPWREFIFRFLLLGAKPQSLAPTFTAWILDVFDAGSEDRTW